LLAASVAVVGLPVGGTVVPAPVVALPLAAGGRVPADRCEVLPLVALFSAEPELKVGAFPRATVGDGVGGGGAAAGTVLGETSLVGVDVVGIPEAVNEKFPPD
jgi:hypothetical protein